MSQKFKIKVEIDWWIVPPVADLRVLKPFLEIKVQNVIVTMFRQVVYFDFDLKQDFNFGQEQGGGGQEWKEEPLDKKTGIKFLFPRLT